MSQHSSFKKSAGSTNASKTVLKRFERIELLKKRGQWKEGQSVLGLIKTKPDVPNIQMFVNKYPNFINNSFDLGYFVHLYTDKLWFDGFIDKLTCSNSIRLLDGTILTTTEKELRELIYSDYTNLNIKLIDDYNLDLSLFYDEFQIPNTNFKEIPVQKLNILIDQMGIIIENSKENKSFSFDIYSVKNFIEDSTSKILEELNKY